MFVITLIVLKTFLANKIVRALLAIEVIPVVANLHAALALMSQILSI
jgi:hypothetical protein